MNKRSEYLRVLGLPPDASWDEVTQAYRDLMRVWHPDRFPNDERLKAKAQQESQRINHAMSELKQLGKSPPPRSERPQRHHERTDTSRTRTTPETDNATSSGTRAHQNGFQFRISPFTIRQSPWVSLARLLGAGFVFYLAFMSMNRTQRDPFQSAFTAMLSFAALDIGIRNILAFLMPGPLVSVDRDGIFFAKLGKLNWIDIDRIWPVIRSRNSLLQITFSARYLQKQSSFTRGLLYLRTRLSPAHATISFQGLEADPVAVLHAVKLRQSQGDIVLGDIKPRALGKIRLATLVSSSCALIVVVRALTNYPISPPEYIAYLTLFLAARSTETALRISRGTETL